MFGGAGFSSERAHVVIVAIDDSGSMKQSDPVRIRLEATSMLALSASGEDQFGIVRFGNEGKWILEPGPSPKPEFLASKFTEFNSSDNWTNFTAPLHLVDQYFETHSTFLRSYDVSIVLITDGTPDPGPQYPGGANQNRRDSIEIAKHLGERGIHVYTIGLGTSVESPFLTKLASETGGFYTPARTAGELRDAFLRTVTRIFSLPAYEQIQGRSRATMHLAKPDLIRAYLFRQNQATTLTGTAVPFFSTEHIAGYELPPAADVELQVAGPIQGAAVVVCVRQPLSFAEGRAISPVLLVDSIENIEVKLLGGGEPQWDRLFMRDAAVQIRLHSGTEADIVQPLYPDPKTQSYKSTVPTSRTGNYEATIRMESPYGAVNYFLAKLKVAAAAVELPEHVMVEYPSFLPAPIRRLVGSKVLLNYVLPVGSADIVFDTPSDVQFSNLKIETAPGQNKTIAIYAGRGHPSGNLTVPYTISWNNGQQHQIRRGMVSVQIAPQGPGEFARRHWLLSALVLLLIIVGYLIWPRHPKLRGILVVDRPSIAKTRIVLDLLKTKSVMVGESSSREELNSDHILVRTGVDRQLFVLTMMKISGGWAPIVKRVDGVPLDTQSVLKNGSKIAVKDREVTFTFYQG
jgi:hypothetical protein